MNPLLIGRSALTFTHHEHEHETWEIIVNTSGSGHFTFGNTARAFREGTIACIPPGIPHRKDSEEGFVDIWIQLPEFPSLDKTKPTFLNDDVNRNITALIEVLYSVQYAKLPNRDTVIFTDMESNRYQLVITGMFYAQHADQSALQRQDAPLTLFIKNVYALEYLVVFCDVLL